MGNGVHLVKKYRELSGQTGTEGHSNPRKAFYRCNCKFLLWSGGFHIFGSPL